MSGVPEADFLKNFSKDLERYVPLAAEPELKADILDAAAEAVFENCTYVEQYYLFRTKMTKDILPVSEPVPLGLDDRQGQIEFIKAKQIAHDREAKRSSAMMFFVDNLQTLMMQKDATHDERHALDKVLLAEVMVL